MKREGVVGETVGFPTASKMDIFFKGIFQIQFKNMLTIEEFKVCFECKEKKGIRTIYDESNTNSSTKIDISPVNHLKCELLTEYRREYEVLEAVLKAKQLQITDIEWELFKSKQEMFRPNRATRNQRRRRSVHKENLKSLDIL